MRTFQGKIRHIKYRFCQSLFFLLLFFNSSHLRLNASPRSLKFFFLIANQKIANPPIPANSNVPITIPAICPPESPSFWAGGVISPPPEDLSSYTAVAFFRFIRTKSERFCSRRLNFVVATVFRLVFYALQCIRKFAHMVFLSTSLPPVLTIVGAVPSSPAAYAAKVGLANTMPSISTKHTTRASSIVLFLSMFVSY